MTDDELIAKAIERVRWLETRIVDKRPPKLRQVTIDNLPKRRISPVREVVHVFFESDDNQGKIDVSLDYQTDECFGTKIIPPTERVSDEKA